MTVTLLHGDCLDIMPTLEAASVDAILTDLPYGTTACAWDEIIPFEPMWAQVKRLLKPRGVFVTTASQPFTSKLVMSNPKWFKYCWVWDKKSTADFLLSKVRPMKYHEDICVFSDKGHTYNPQMKMGAINHSHGNSKNIHISRFTNFSTTNPPDVLDGLKYPRSIIEIGKYPTTKENIHPTQKPVALYEYLIRTYTNEGDTVLDICAGSGTTGVAAIRTGRNAILIEKDAKYFEVMKGRVNEAIQIGMAI